ncbi:hypothetical protein D3C76_1535320 [compost metagenome]
MRDSVLIIKEQCPQPCGFVLYLLPLLLGHGTTDDPRTGVESHCTISDARAAKRNAKLALCGGKISGRTGVPFPVEGFKRLNKIARRQTRQTCDGGRRL